MGKPLNNPFTPTFGSIPPELAGRQKIIGDVLEGLDNGPGDPNRATIYVGARGSGKTVLLAKIAEEASANGWISANVNAEPTMLNEIMMQIKDKSSEFLSPVSLSHITSITIGGASITRSEKKSGQRTTWRSEIASLLKELNAKGIGLLITVDELDVRIEELRTLVVAFQHFVRERRDVAIIMAGLPAKVSALLRDDSISFLRRAFQHQLEHIEASEVRYSMKKTVERAGRAIDPEALDVAAKNTEGFPFMIQLIGYHMWRQSPDKECISIGDAQEAVLLANMDLERMIFHSTFRDLSEKDVAFLCAMLEDEAFSKISDIAARMGVSSKYASEYRRRLIAHGVIGSRGHGRVGFELPMFREYLQNRITA